MILLNKRDGLVVEPEKALEIIGEYDVLVVGGGMAGVGAAITSSRAGCKTILIERETALGGLATIGLVNIPLDAPSGLAKEMMKELTSLNALWHRNTDPEKHKLVLDRMVVASGCDLLVHAYIVETIVSGDEVKGVVIEGKSGRQVILAKRIIDCSGDADAAYFSGAEYMSGRKCDGKHQACSLEFRLGGVNWDDYVGSDKKKRDPRWETAIKTGLTTGDLAYEVDNHLNWITHVPGRPEHKGMDEVSICFAHSRNCKPLDTKDLTRMYLEGREQADMLSKFIKKNIPGFTNSYLIDTAPLLGVRETRRIVGEYILEAKDLAQHRTFDDVISISGHGYDLHNPDGPGNIKWAKMEDNGKEYYGIFSYGAYNSSWFPEGGPDAFCDGFGRSGEEMSFPAIASYDIPYRSLIPVKMENLAVGGRCLSSDFMAQSGIRLVITCMNTGEAAGAAAAISLRHNLRMRDIDRVELQSMLLDNGANLGQAYRTISGLDEKYFAGLEEDSNRSFYSANDF